MKQLAIIGGGSWGTALAVVARPALRSIRLWVYEADLAARMAQTRENDVFLPGFPLPRQRRRHQRFAAALEDAEIVLGVMPSHHARRIYRRDAAAPARPACCFVSATKGLESGTLLRMSEVMREVAGERFEPRVAVLSGPDLRPRDRPRRTRRRGHRLRTTDLWPRPSSARSPARPSACTPTPTRPASNSAPR